MISRDAPHSAHVIACVIGRSCQEIGDRTRTIFRYFLPLPLPLTLTQTLKTQKNILFPQSNTGANMKLSLVSLMSLLFLIL